MSDDACHSRSRAGGGHLVEPEGLRVEALRAIDELEPWRGALTRLNLASRRPTPFNTPEYLATFLAHDEYAMPGCEPLLLLALEGERLIGFLPLRRRPDRVLGRSRTKLEVLVTHDNERPGIVARAEDEARCAAAFYRHVAEREPGWTFLELMEQDDTSALLLAPRALDPRRFHVRRYLNNPNATIDLSAGFEAWFRGLNNFRVNVGKRVRGLLAAGDVALLSSTDPTATTALLDVFLDVEGRSWKRPARAGISRHPTRVELFRALLGPGQPAVPVVHLLLLDGVPISAMVLLLFAGTMFGLEAVYDDAYREFAPGNVTLTLAIRDAVARGARALDLLGNFAYYKAKAGAVITETSAVQIYRRGTLHHARALAGALRRRLLGPPRTQRDADFNLSKPRDATVEAADRAVARGRLEEILTALSARGARVDRLSGEALAAAFPFQVRRRSA
jgi:CelD/BcsL family acetyltransferase involved in cellulose biosynthesis